MRLALVPRSSEFYELFTSAGANALETARRAETRFREYPDSSVTQASVKELELVGDQITRDIILLLNTHYVTPFDREDIYQLATAVDEVVDHIEHACDLLDLYGLDAPTRDSLDQCRILVGATEQLAAALAGLRGRVGVQEALEAIHQLEDEGDAIVRRAIGSLFQHSRIDPLVVIRWKSIYEVLEDAIDACETVANVVGNVVVKNA
jgi:hypothetical protein